jgi:hypothetical protein
LINDSSNDNNKTDQYKKKIAEWISKGQNAQNIVSTSITKDTYDISPSHDTTNNNNSIKPILDKILIGIDHTNVTLEQMQTDFKALLEDIKNTLKNGADRSSSDETKLN